MNRTNANVTGRKPSSVVGEALTGTAVDPEELVDDKEAAKILRQQPQTLAAWRCDGKGPRYLKIGRSILYQRSAISAFLGANVVVPSAKS